MRIVVLLALVGLISCRGEKPKASIKTTTNPVVTVLCVIDRLERDRLGYKDHTWFEVVDTPNAKFLRTGLFWGAPGDSLYVVLKTVEWVTLQLIREQQIEKKPKKPNAHPANN